VTTPSQPDDNERTPAPGRGVDAETTTVSAPVGGTGHGAKGPDGGSAPGDGGGSTGSTGTPPPWQRGGATGPQPAAGGAGGPGAGGPGPQRPQQPRGGPGGPGGPGGSGGSRANTALIDAPTNQLSPEQLGMRLHPNRNDSTAADEPEDIAQLSASRAAKAKTPRRASLQLKRFDPWSVLKLAGVLAVALFFVWMFAVGVLYAVLDGMGVWAQLNGTYQTLTSDTGGTGQLITAGGVFGVAAIVGAVNAILFTALASISAFIYNISADVAGGIEVTLSERD